MVRSGELKAPIVIGRDHLDSGSVASPNRETEAMRDGSDAVSDWPLLNALLNTAGGATWVSLHHGGGVGMGYSQHAGVVIVCDGTDAAAKRLERVLWNDPATGVMRHADAGYDKAIECAREQGLNLPMLAADGRRTGLRRPWIGPNRPGRPVCADVDATAGKISGDKSGRNACRRPANGIASLAAPFRHRGKSAFGSDRPGRSRRAIRSHVRGSQ